MRWKPKERREKILDLIKRKGEVSFNAIQNYLKKHGNPVQDRQLYEDIRVLRKLGVSGKGIPIILNSEKKYLIDPNSSLWDYDTLGKQTKNTLPLILSMLKPYSHIPAVEYLINDLEKHHSVTSEKMDQMVVSHNKKLNPSQTLTQSNILNAVSTITDFMQEGKAIEFLYSHVHIGKEHEFKESHMLRVYPLQIRLYEGRYYLLAIPVEKEVNSKNLRTYAIDEIVKFRIDIATDESGEEEITFNWHETFSKIDIEGLYEYCIGIMRPTDPNVKPSIIRRWFKGWAASLVEAAPLHHTQKIEAVKDDELLISIKVYETPELEYVFERFREFSYYK